MIAKTSDLMMVAYDERKKGVVLKKILENPSHRSPKTVYYRV